MLQVSCPFSLAQVVPKNSFKFETLCNISNELEDRPVGYLFDIFAAFLNIWEPSPPSVTRGQIIQ